ncbi:MAG: Inner rane component of cytoplasmic domain [Pseudomonadota bacterium]
MKNKIAFKLVTIFCLCLLTDAVRAEGETAVNNSVPALPLQRQVSLRGYEVYDKRKLRMHVIVDESDAAGRYLLNTLDAKSFRLRSDSDSHAPLEPVSLSTYATRSPAVPRQTALVFEAGPHLPQRQFDSIRAAAANFLSGFRSEVFSVRAATAEKESRLAWLAPGQSENPRAIQKSILESGPVTGRPGIAAGFCAAVKEFETDSPDNVLKQKSLILLSNAPTEPDAAWTEAKRCLVRANELGVRIFWIRVRDQSTATSAGNKFDSVIQTWVEKSGGFVAHSSALADPSAALNNVGAYLDDEYVLEFDLSQHEPYSDAFEFVLTVNYHGNILHSKMLAFKGFTAEPRPEDIITAQQSEKRARQNERRTLWILGASLFSIALVVFYFLKKTSAGCQKCGFRVHRSFQDCPFKNQKTFGRLSVIQGPALGAEFPLFSGINTLGRGRFNTIHWNAKGLSKKHARIIVMQRKALFEPITGAETRVNGVRIAEPRLLGSGTILRMGESVCRVDFKEGT